MESKRVEKIFQVDISGLYHPSRWLALMTTCVYPPWGLCRYRRVAGTAPPFPLSTVWGAIKHKAIVGKPKKCGRIAGCETDWGRLGICIFSDYLTNLHYLCPLSLIQTWTWTWQVSCPLWSEFCSCKQCPCQFISSYVENNQDFLNLYFGLCKL